MDKICNFNVLLGKTLSSIVNTGNDKLIFTTNNGEVYEMYHDQECSEIVTIDDICGDLNDLIDSPILQAEETRNSDDPMSRGGDESFTWTFYKLATFKGYVTIKWYGFSNGYYSESVDLVKIIK